jgi:hypothetical protein
MPRFNRQAGMRILGRHIEKQGQAFIKASPAHLKGLSVIVPIFRLLTGAYRRFTRSGKHGRTTLPELPTSWRHC